MEKQIEKLYEDLESSIIKNPCNDVQEGFNMAVQSIHSKLSHILGKSKVYTFEEFAKFLEE